MALFARWLATGLEWQFLWSANRGIYVNRHRWRSFSAARRHSGTLDGPFVWAEASGKDGKMFLTAIKKLFVLLFSCGVGMFAGGIVVTPVIALMNYLAQDGPIFPAPLVGLVVVAPISLILFVNQGMVLAYEWISSHHVGSALFRIGALGGLAAGLIPYFLAIAPYQSNSNHWGLFVFGGLGIFQGLVVFGVHWVANRLSIPISSPKPSSNPRSKI